MMKKQSLFMLFWLMLLGLNIASVFYNQRNWRDIFQGMAMFICFSESVELFIKIKWSSIKLELQTI